MPIPVTSPFLPLSPQIASAWRMMWQYWCQHHSPGAWELRTVMYSWVPSESSIALYNREPRSTYRVAVARPLCQLIHYSCMSFSDSVWTTLSITNAPIGDETFSLDVDCATFESRRTCIIFRIRSTTPRTAIVLDRLRSYIERDS